jgi:hypothetical protein
MKAWLLALLSSPRGMYMSTGSGGWLFFGPPAPK